MSDIALTNATAREAEIRRDIEQREREIARLTQELQKAQEDLDKTRSFIRTWYEMAGIQPPESSEHVESKGPTSPPRRPKNPDREFVVDKSLEIIRASGAPMPRKPLFDALAEMGIEIKGKDPEMVLSTMLWRSQDRVVRLPNHGYWPADQSYGPAGYSPLFDDIVGVAATEPEGGEIELDMTDDELPLA